MVEDSSPQEGQPTLKPLPSVDLPLLREERRAHQRWVRSVGGAAAALGIGVVLVAVFGFPKWPAHRGERKPSRSVGATASTSSEHATRDRAFPDSGAEPVIETTQPDSPLALGATSRTAGRVGSARTFREALLSSGLSNEDAQSIAVALKPVFDFRRCRPEHTFTIDRDASGALMRFEYKPSVLRTYEVTRRAQGRLVGRRLDVPVHRTRIGRAGVLSTSLADALDQLGLKKSLVGVFVEAFDGRVSFSSSSRQGDQFKIIVDEEYVAGQFLRYGPPLALEWKGEKCGTLRAFWYQPEGAPGEYFDGSGRAIRGGWLRTPVRYDHISSRFDVKRRHPVLRRVMPHLGVDYAASPGTPVWAAADGQVSFAGARGANGNMVAIRHSGGFETGYAHLSRIASGVRRGVQVKQRQVIGFVGSTGRSTGPHLHFGLQRKGRFVDPLAELNGPGRPLPAKLLSDFKKRTRPLTAELESLRSPSHGRAAMAPAASPRRNADTRSRLASATHASRRR